MSAISFIKSEYEAREKTQVLVEQIGDAIRKKYEGKEIPSLEEQLRDL